MSFQDPIADMIVRIRNAQMRNKLSVSLPFSKLKHAISRVLVEEGYLKGFTIVGESASTKQLQLDIKYYDSKPVIEEMSRVSRPGLRRYSAASDLPKVKGGLGILIVSTCKGVMSDKNARSQNVGGEILCSVA